MRALESLGVAHRSSYTPAFWASYVEECRGLAKQHSMSLRTLDKALWQYSKELSAKPVGEQRSSRAPRRDAP